MESVIQEPRVNEQGVSVYSPIDMLLPVYTGFINNIPNWGSQPAFRDKLLRDFWPTEPVLASAIFSTISRYAAFGWSLDGPELTVKAVRNILHASDLGAGWMSLIVKTLLDLFTQDNGAFIETVRNDSMGVVQLNHLDSARCIRTGRHKEPVIYIDTEGKKHQLKDVDVICLTEFPSAIETARGMQYCVITRLLRAAQILKDIETYKYEKIGGRYTRAIHIVSGVSKRAIDEALNIQSNEADAQNVTRYIQPLIVASLDPTANVNAKTLDLAALPDGFSEEDTMKWYINQLALAFGGDYQDYAPLPGGNLGTAQQSQVLHLKGRGKGPALFMRMLEQQFNFFGIMPGNVSFSFGEQDTAEDAARQNVRLLRSQTVKNYVDSGIVTTKVAAQILADTGDIDSKYLPLLGVTDTTPDTTIESSVP